MAKAKTKKRRLSKLSIHEVSLVDAPATGRTFFFAKRKDGTDEVIELNKQDTSITIQSDGTSSGTTVKINGKAIVDITNFGFSYWTDEASSLDGYPVSCSYTVRAKNQNKEGFRSTRTYVLSKAFGDIETSDVSDTNEVEKASEEDIVIIQNFMGLGDLVKPLVIEKDAGESLVKSLNVLDEYKRIMPEEVGEALQDMAKLAISKNMVDDDVEDNTESEETEVSKTADNEKDEEMSKDEETKEVEEKTETKTEDTKTTETTNTAEDKTETKTEDTKERMPTVEEIASKVVEAMKEDGLIATSESKEEEDVDEEVEVSAEEFAELVAQAAATGN